MTELELPAVMDRAAATELADKLGTALAMGDVYANGDRVTQVGQIGLQLLLSVASTASAKGREFSIIDASDALHTAAELAGVATILPFSASA